MVETRLCPLTAGNKSLALVCREDLDHPRLSGVSNIGSACQCFGKSSDIETSSYSTSSTSTSSYSTSSQSRFSQLAFHCEQQSVYFQGQWSGKSSDSGTSPKSSSSYPESDSSQSTSWQSASSRSTHRLFHFLAFISRMITRDLVAVRPPAPLC